MNSNMVYIVNPLRKNYLTTKPSPAFPVVSRDQERELESLFLNLQHMETSTKKLQKEMKKYSELLAQSSKQEQKITADLSGSQLCQQNEELRNMVEEYHTVTAKVCDSNQEFSVLCRQTFQDPLKQYLTFFGPIDAALHHQTQLAQEWQISSAKVRKLETKERSASNIVKLERERQTSEALARELKAYHASLVTDLTQFMNKSSDVFNPTLQALVRAQLNYYGELTSLFTKLVSDPSPSKSPSSSESEAESVKRIHDKLNQIKALSIVKK